MRCTVVWTVLCITACLEGERVRGNVPVGTVAPPPLASAETFLRRAFADLLDLPRRLHARELDEADVLARLSRSTAALALSGPDAHARFLVRHLLGRETNAFELRNAARMAQIAAFVAVDAPPTGIVLRRPGKTVHDLVALLVAPHAFPEARIRAVPVRLLGPAPQRGEV